MQRAGGGKARVVALHTRLAATEAVTVTTVGDIETAKCTAHLLQIAWNSNFGSRNKRRDALDKARLIADFSSAHTICHDEADNGPDVCEALLTPRQALRLMGHLEVLGNSFAEDRRFPDQGVVALVQDRVLRPRRRHLGRRQSGTGGLRPDPRPPQGSPDGVAGRRR